MKQPRTKSGRYRKYAPGERLAGQMAKFADEAAPGFPILAYIAALTLIAWVAR